MEDGRVPMPWVKMKHAQRRAWQIGGSFSFNERILANNVVNSFDERSVLVWV